MYEYRPRPVESKHGRGKVHIASRHRDSSTRLAFFIAACGAQVTQPKTDAGAVNCPECLHVLGLLSNSGEPTP